MRSEPCQRQAGNHSEQLRDFLRLLRRLLNCDDVPDWMRAVLEPDLSEIYSGLFSEKAEGSPLSKKVRSVELLLFGESISDEFREKLNAAMGGIGLILDGLGRLDAGVQTSVEFDSELLGELGKPEVHVEKLVDRDNGAAAPAVGAEKPEVGVLRGEFLDLKAGAAALGASGSGHAGDAATADEEGQG